MINIPAILIANGATLMILFVLLFSSNKTIKSRLPDNKMFFMMVYSLMIQCISETVSYLTDGHTVMGIRDLSLMMNSLLYINNMFFVIVWIMYADYKVFSNVRRLRRIYPIISIPAYFICIGSVVNIFQPVFFSISSNNVYERTSIHALPYLIAYLYLFYGIILIYANRNRSSRYVFFPALLFMVPIVIGSILQYTFYGYSIITICVAISLVSLYINVQNEVSFTDPLSGAFTRQYMNMFLDAETRKLNQKKLLAGIMIDIDRFKRINDNYGHLMGDDAIRSAGEILRTCTSSPGFVVRLAGDEFVVILIVDDEFEIHKTMRWIKEYTNEFNASSKRPYTLRFSMGYSIYDRQNDTIESFLNRMDREMYADKGKNYPANER
ncbi:MAG: GGDEF domain-containing protein [Acutalibacteraceae bacterium]